MNTFFCKKLKLINFAFALFFLSASCIFADTVHTVQKGDTLYSIGKKYGTTVEELRALNGISGNDIKIGQKLVTGGEKSASSATPAQKSEKKTDPAKTKIYTVQKGDTWYGIARRNSISVGDLYALNNTDGSKGLKIGDKIKVPASASSAAQSKNDAQNSSSNKNAEPPKVPFPPVNPHNFSGKKGNSNLVWPVQKPDVYYISGKVSGVSLSAKQNERVNAIKSGTVMFSGAYRGFGNVVFIQSKTGHIYAYTGLGKVLVSRGEYVDYGSQIGEAGIDSYSSKPQICLMVFQNGIPIDPAKAPRG